MLNLCLHVQTYERKYSPCALWNSSSYKNVLSFSRSSSTVTSGGDGIPVLQAKGMCIQHNKINAVTIHSCRWLIRASFICHVPFRAISCNEHIHVWHDNQTILCTVDAPEFHTSPFDGLAQNANRMLRKGGEILFLSTLTIIFAQPRSRIRFRCLSCNIPRALVQQRPQRSLEQVPTTAQAIAWTQKKQQWPRPRLQPSIFRGLVGCAADIGAIIHTSQENRREEEGGGGGFPSPFPFSPLRSRGRFQRDFETIY